MKAGIGIDGDDNLAGGCRDSGIADQRKVFGIFPDGDHPGFPGNLFGAIGAAIQNHHRFDLAWADFRRSGHRCKAPGKIFLFIMSGNDDRDFH